MRWAELFTDLEARAEALDRLERAGEIADRTRAELADLATSDRLAAALGRVLRVRAAGGARASGRLHRCGPGWLLLDIGEGAEVVVALDAAVSIGGLDRRALSPTTRGSVASRLGIRHVLRALTVDRSAVRIHLVDGSTISGTVDRVGADFLDVAEHDAGQPRRSSEVRGVELVPLDAIAMIRRER
jgi:hypothetical protein